MAFILPPTFRTERLILKKVSLNDAPSYAEHFVDYEIIRNLAAEVPWPYPKDGVVDYLKNNIIPKQGKGYWNWGIFLKTNPNELIGFIDLWEEPKPDNRAFWLGRKFWGQGSMTEAMTPILDFAFETLEFKSLIFGNAKGNDRSRRIKEKTGCEFIGVEPAKFVDPELTEHELWRLTAAHWRKYKATQKLD